MHHLALFILFLYLCSQICKNMQEKKPITPYKKGLREVILKAAMKAFIEKGIRAVKMDDIAESLAISKRTMYEIYGTKEELLYEGLKAVRESRKAQFMEMGKEKDLMDPLLKDINDTIKKIADKKGLKVVVDKSTVVYGGTDITDEVAKALQNPKK